MNNVKNIRKIMEINDNQITSINKQTESVTNFTVENIGDFNVQKASIRIDFFSPNIFNATDSVTLIFTDEKAKILRDTLNKLYPE